MARLEGELSCVEALKDLKLELIAQKEVQFINLCVYMCNTTLIEAHIKYKYSGCYALLHIEFP